MPDKSWNSHLIDKGVAITHLNSEFCVDKTVVFETDMLHQAHVKVNGKVIEDLNTTCQTVQDVQHLLGCVDKLTVCCGTGKSKAFSMECLGMTKSKNQKRCDMCTKERRRLQKRETKVEKIQKRQEERKKKKVNKIKSLKRCNKRMKEKIKELKAEMKNMLKKCQEIKEETLMKCIADLPEHQREAVKACFSCAKRKGPKGRRYTMEWLHECVMMRMRSRSLYEHIKNQNILPLPSLTTINNYIQAMGCSFGFQDPVFQTLPNKLEYMPNKQKRGILQIDEVKVSPGVSFDKKRLKFQGLVCVGEEDDSGEEFGDHVLVFQFQPFQGSWVQAVGCFLTKSNMKAETLTKLTMECIMKLEGAGLFVDAVCTDGASWNRQMWKKVGVTSDKPWCRHPMDTSETNNEESDEEADMNCRKLWFISDFPHLLKCMQNCLVSKRSIQTPDGCVELKYWEALLAEEETNQGLRLCPKLTKSVVNPQPFEKMNVGKAFKFFGGTVAAGMVVHEKRGVQNLKGCEETVNFIRKTNAMADVMNSSTPLLALKPGLTHWKVLEDYLSYFMELKRVALQKARDAEEERKQDYLRKKKQASQTGEKIKRFKGKKIDDAEVFSSSTDEGLKATITAAMQITEMLVNEHNWKYLMTARLNQDALERFFGLIRGSSGDSHPQPQKFVQVFRLLTTYSLVKPFKGGNITGGELLSTLFSLKDIQLEGIQNRHEEFIKRLDDFVSRGENLEELAQITTVHTYNEISIDNFAMKYVAGYVARKSRKFCKNCDHCAAQLSKPAAEAEEEDLFIEEKSNGYLTLPSDILMEIIAPIEKGIMHVYSTENKSSNFLFVVMDYLETVKIGVIGCEQHYKVLTKDIMKFYILMRMHFLCDKWNKCHEELLKKQRLYRKQANLM